MTPPPRLAGRLLAVAVLAALLSGAAPATGAALATGATLATGAAAQGTAGLTYVALGDSYSAGLGITPASTGSVAACAQSAVNYPHRVATALKLTLTDVTCSGAETGDLTTAGVAPAQLAALSASTDIVTLTIGGNDLGFASIAAACAAASATGPLLLGSPAATCESTFVANGVDSLAATVTSTVSPALASTYAAIAAAAPQARVFVLGYPSIMPAPGDVPAGGCFRGILTSTNSFPFGDTDTTYLRSVEDDLDAAIQSATTAAGFTYLPTFAGSATHSACATDGAWVNGAILSKGGVAPASLHPNVAGVSYLTRTTEAAIEAAFPAAYSPAAVASTPSGSWIVAALVGVAAALLIGAVVVALVRRRSRRQRV